MAVFLRRDRWIEQPPGPVEIDPTHPLGQYAVAALTGAMVGTHDACGNEIAFTGSGIYQVSRSSGRFFGHTGASSSVIFWRDKTVGNFGTDDFLIYTQFARLVASTNGVAIGKGDTGASEWMMGGHTAQDAFRFYGAGGAIAPTSQPGIVPMDVTRAYGAYRVGEACSTYVDGGVITTDATASNALDDTTHHMTLFSGDYNGTTYDNGRIYPIEIAHAVVLRGIGGIDVARALTDEPYAIYKPRTVRRYFLSTASSPTINSITASSITQAGARITLGLTR